jgi:hypothetical protein
MISYLKSMGKEEDFKANECFDLEQPTVTGYRGTNLEVHFSGEYEEIKKYLYLGHCSR